MKVNDADLDVSTEKVGERRSQGFLNLVFGDETAIDRSDFVEVVVSKRCNWLFEERAIKNRLDIQMTVSRRKEEKKKAMIDKAKA